MRVGCSFGSNLAVPLTTSFAGAQTLWWPSGTSGTPRVVLIFIPGNPGLSSYYLEFLQSIYTSKTLGSDIEIVAVSHRGHAPLPAVGTNAVWGDNAINASQASKGWGTTLADQIRHKIGIVDAVRRAYPRQDREGCEGTQIVVAGHSIGAYIASEVVKARPEAVDGVHMLFPTLAWIGRTPNARKIRVLTMPFVMRVVLPLPLLILSLLPLWGLVWMIRLTTGQPSPAALATAELLTTRGAVANALSMANDEFKTVRSLDPSTLSALRNFTSDHRGKLRSYWAAEESDGWAPGWIRTQVESELSLQRVHLPPALGVGGGARRKSHVRTRSFSVSEYRSSPGSIPDLRHARALRRPNGEIVIEAQVDEPSSESEPEPQEPTSERAMHYHYGRARATSTHCRIGMPHAFCLNHSHQMATVVAHWISHDHLESKSN